MKRKLLLVCVPLVLSYALLAVDWASYGHDPQRTSWSPKETDINRDNVGLARGEFGAEGESEDEQNRKRAEFHRVRFRFVTSCFSDTIFNPPYDVSRTQVFAASPREWMPLLFRASKR